MGLMQPRSELKNHMILAKTTSSCCTSTRRATSSIAIYLVGYKICTKSTTYKMFIELARFLQEIWQVVFLLFFLSIWLFFLLVSFDSFLLSHSPTLCQQQDICQLAQILLLGNYTVQMCKAQAIIKSYPQ